jgi:sucrose-6-phosphate hydrolase SacC (GH32 family)
MRPAFHFTPPQNWINDPNGLLFHDGLWHLCYQHNPHGPDWGHLHWGHAVSRDLLSWQHWPHALHEDPAAARQVFSGSLVADPASGRLAALYSAHYGYGDPGWHEHVELAWSDDGARTFQRVPDPRNPVLRGSSPKFGDPKVWRDVAHGCWFMACIEGWPDQGHVVFARSADLVRWKRVGEFHAPDTAPGVWECPDFNTLRDPDGAPLDLLKVNTWNLSTGEKNVRWFPGRFDGETFHANAAPLRGPTPPGDPGYAESTWNPDDSGRIVVTGWIPQKPSPSRPWTGLLWLPRELTAARAPDGALELRQAPVRELLARRGTPTMHRPAILTPRALLLPAPKPQAPADWELRIAPDGDARVELALSPDCALVITHESMSLRRPGSDFVASSPRRRPAGAPIHLRVIADRTALAIFADDGAFAVSIATDGPPFDGSLSLSCPAGGAVLSDARAWSLHTAGGHGAAALKQPPVSSRPAKSPPAQTANLP